MGRDLRQHTRTDVSKHDVRFIDPDTHRNFGAVIDLSTAGMLLRALDDIEPGKIIRGCLVAGETLSSPIRAMCREVTDDGNSHLSISKLDLDDWISIRALINDALADRPVAR